MRQPEKNTTNPTCPQQKQNRFSCKFGPTTRNRCRCEVCHFCPHMGKIVFSAPTQTNFCKFALFQSNHIRAESLKFVSCPFSPDNQTPMNAPPSPWNKEKLFFSFFWDAHPKISKCGQNLLNARHFQQKSKPEMFKNNNFKQIRECPKQYFEHFHLTPFFHPLKPLFL